MFKTLTHDRNPEIIDIKAIRTIGEALPAVVRGEINLLEVLMKDELLSQFYAGALGIESYQREVARLAGQISNKYPHINVLEIGMHSSSYELINLALTSA